VSGPLISAAIAGTIGESLGFYGCIAVREVRYYDSRGLVPGDQVYIYTAGAYTTCYASAFNGFSAPTTHCLP
jgi:diaminopimelate decarboxylase